MPEAISLFAEENSIKEATCWFLYGSLYHISCGVFVDGV